jgi:outer membrane lipase/esterase
MKFATSACVAALGVALFGAASQAQAQSYSRVVAFGDSLSDNGNINILAPGAGPPFPYVGGRFSNGPTFVEDLNHILTGTPMAHIFTTAGSTDWAVGGAETGSGNYGSALLPGIYQEIDGTLAGDGFPGYFALGGTFGPHDLVTLWGGANDLFAGFLPASLNANPTGYIATVATTAAGNISGYVNQIAAAGAGTIVVPNLPNLAATPQFAGSPAIPLAILGANTFNSALLTNLQTDAKANPHTNIILIDTNEAVSYLQAHGAKFGFTNTTTACTSVPACALGTVAVQNTYQFWDGVHPTEAAHALLASIIDDYVTYGDRGADMGVETESALRRRTQTYDTALAGLQERDFGANKTGVGVTLEYNNARADARDLVGTTTDSGETLRINLDGVVSPTLRVGGLFSISNATVQTDATGTTGGASFRSQTASADALAGWRSGNLFINADGGVGIDSYSDIDRRTGTAGVTNHANTQGWSAGLKVQAGVWFDLAHHWTVSPRVALGFTRGLVNGYTENGPFDRYVYGENAINATTLEGTVRLAGPIAGAVHAHLEAGYRDYVSYDAGAVATTLADNVAQTLSRTLQSPDGGVGLVDLGVGGPLLKSAKWDVSYRGSFSGRYEDNLAHANVTIAF